MNRFREAARHARLGCGSMIRDPRVNEARARFGRPPLRRRMFFRAAVRALFARRRPTDLLELDR